MQLFNQLHKYYNRNLLFTNEVAAQLNVSKQTISNLHKNGELVPVKESPNGNVYLWQDVLAYMTKKGLLQSCRPNPPKYFFKKTGPSHIRKYVEGSLQNLSKIVRVLIFFDRIDAAAENFFIPNEERRQGDLQAVDVPNMVITNEDGTEMWLMGCNCGYPGTGPRLSYDILKMIGIEEDIRSMVFNHRIVKYILDEDGHWDAFGIDSHFDRNSLKSDEDYFEYQRTHANLYWHRDGLTLIQDGKWYQKRSSNYSLEVLTKYASFIQNPVEFILFQNSEQAIEFGYFDPSGDSGSGPYGVPYRLIIKDASGRQLWLNPRIEDNKHISKQPQLLPLLQTCGFDIPTERLDHKLIDWFKIILNKVSVENPIVGKKNT